MSMNEVLEREVVEEDETGPAISPLKGRAVTASNAAAGPWRLIWHRLVRQKIAMIAGAIILVLYLIAAFCEFLAPALPDTARAVYPYAPPQGIELFVQNPDGSWSEDLATGTGFPKVFYLNYHYYRLYFPLIALSEFVKAQANR